MANTPFKESDELITAGEAACRALQRRNINTAFCLSGAAHTYLLRDMERLSFKIVSTRTEASTVAAADGYARIKGAPGIAMVAGKQGLPNTLGGICTAQMACSAIVVLASVYAPNSREALDEEPSDQLAMVRPYSKWARIAPSPERLEEFLEAALHSAASGRPGVAVLGIPTQYPKEKITATTSMVAVKSPPSVPTPDADAIIKAAELIKKAERPLVLAGSGAAYADAQAEIRDLTALGLPVFGHALGRGLASEDMERGFPWPLAQVAAKNADVVMAVGIRLSQRIGFGMAPRFANDAKFIQVDIEASEIGRTRHINVPITGDAAASVGGVASILREQSYKAPPTDWINHALVERRKRVAELAAEKEGPIHPLAIGRKLMEIMPEDTIFVSDGADIYNWMSAIVRIRRPRSYMDHYPLGSMGIGFGLALGAAAASQEIAKETGSQARPVVLVTGDGSFGYYNAELNAARICDLPFLCIVANDGAWGTEKNSHLMHFDHAINCELGQWDYELIGKAFDCYGEKITKLSAVGPAIERGIHADRPTVLNILTDPDAGLARKQDPRLKMVTFEDLPASHDALYQTDLE